MAKCACLVLENARVELYKGVLKYRYGLVRDVQIFSHLVQFDKGSYSNKAFE